MWRYVNWKCLNMETLFISCITYITVCFTKSGHICILLPKETKCTCTITYMHAHAGIFSYVCTLRLYCSKMMYNYCNTIIGLSILCKYARIVRPHIIRLHSQLSQEQTLQSSSVLLFELIFWLKIFTMHNHWILL